VQRVVIGIQAKLKVGQPGDIYEQEADRVADAVMRMPEPQVQRRAEEEEEETLQIKEIPGQTPEATSDLETRIHALRGSGQPLPEADRSFMARRFGVDFGDVRVHTDSDAVQLSKELNAEAFTYGRDIYFGVGGYSPSTSSGKRLMAHELTHVVQQSDASLASPIRVTNPSEPVEAEANAAGQAVVQEESFSVTEQPQAAVARQVEGGAPATPGAAGRPEPAPAEPTEEAEKTYNVSLWGKEYKNLTKTQAFRVLRDIYNTIRNWTYAEREGHQYLKKIREEQWIVGFCADVIGGVKMPPLEMWDGPLSHLKVAKSLLDGGFVSETAAILVAAEISYRECHKKYYDYKGGTVKGAELAVTGLKVTAYTGMVAAAVATGGAAVALEAGTVTTISAGAAGAYFYGKATPEEAGLETETAFAQGVLTASSFPAFAAITGGEIAQFVVKNRSKFPLWKSAASTMLKARRFLKTNAPELYNLVWDFALKEFAARVPEAYEEKDAAKFIGILVGSLSKKALAGSLTTLKLIGTVLLKILTQLPKALKAVPLTIKEYEESAKQLVKELKALGCDIDVKTANKVVKELSKPGVQKQLKGLIDGFQKLLADLG
jgi:hypothetical protein